MCALQANNVSVTGTRQAANRGHTVDLLSVYHFRCFRGGGKLWSLFKRTERSGHVDRTLLITEETGLHNSLHSVYHINSSGINPTAWSSAARNHFGLAIQIILLTSVVVWITKKLYLWLNRSGNQNWEHLFYETRLKTWAPLVSKCVSGSRNMHRHGLCWALTCLWAVAVWQLAGLSTTHAWKANMLEKGEMKEMELVWLPSPADWY